MEYENRVSLIIIKSKIKMDEEEIKNHAIAFAEFVINNYKNKHVMTIVYGEIYQDFLKQRWKSML